MTKHRTTTRAVALGGLLTLALAAPAAAGGNGATDVFTVGGGGIYTVADDGSVVLDQGQALVTDRRVREMLDATLSVVLATDDGTFPEPDACEPASATFVVEGQRDVAMTLEGTGTYCARRHPVFPTFVERRFEGRYVVTDAKRPMLRGDEGTFSVTLSGGFMAASTSSFIPEGS